MALLRLTKRCAWTAAHPTSLPVGTAPRRRATPDPRPASLPSDRYHNVTIPTNADQPVHRAHPWQPTCGRRCRAPPSSHSPPRRPFCRSSPRAQSTPSAPRAPGWASRAPGSGPSRTGSTDRSWTDSAPSSPPACPPRPSPSTPRPRPCAPRRPCAAAAVAPRWAGRCWHACWHRSRATAMVSWWGSETTRRWSRRPLLGTCSCRRSTLCGRWLPTHTSWARWSPTTASRYVSCVYACGMLVSRAGLLCDGRHPTLGAGGGGRPLCRPCPGGGGRPGHAGRGADGAAAGWVPAGWGAHERTQRAMPRCEQCCPRWLSSHNNTCRVFHHGFWSAQHADARGCAEAGRCAGADQAAGHRGGAGSRCGACHAGAARGFGVGQHAGAECSGCARAGGVQRARGDRRQRVWAAGACCGPW